MPPVPVNPLLSSGPSADETVLPGACETDCTTNRCGLTVCSILNILACGNVFLLQMIKYALLFFAGGHLSGSLHLF